MRFGTGMAVWAALICYCLVAQAQQRGSCAHCGALPGTAQTVDWRTTHRPEEMREGVLLVNLRPERLTTATPTSLGIPELDATLRGLGIQRVEQRFPRATPPRAGGARDVEIRTQYVLHLSPGRLVLDAVEALGRMPEYFQYAEPLYFQHIQAPYLPNDFDSAQSWFAPLIQAPDAWGVQQGDPNVIIAIVDVGTFYMHHDMIGNVYRNTADPINGTDDDADGYIDNYFGWDFCGNNFILDQPQPDANPQPTSIALDHGTFTAGLASAHSDNDTGIVGAGFQCRFMPLKVACEALGQSVYFGYEAIVYAADHGASIINCSGGGFSATQAALDVVNYATFNHDALVIAAGGNDPAPAAQVPFPARYDNVLCVTGSTNTDALGQNTAGCRIDIAAPGNSRLIHPNGYFSFGGTYTSFASPITAGVAGLVRSEFPGLSALQVRQRIRATSDNIYALPANVGLEYQYGRGRLNAYRALTDVTPGIQADTIRVTDGNNNLAQLGDTLSVRVFLRNYLDATPNVTVQLVSGAPLWLEVLAPDSWGVGAMGTLASAHNYATPYRVVVRPGAPVDTDIQMRLAITDGAYSDYQCFTIRVHPGAVAINTPSAHTVASTASHVGHIGGSGFGTPPGQGFTYLNTNYLFEGGMILGQNRNQLADNLRQSAVLGFSPDFQPETYITSADPGTYANQDVIAVYNDSGLVAPNNVQVRMEAYAWRTSPDDKFILVRYILKNNGLTAIDSLYTGWMADWDLGPLPNANFADYDPALRLSYSWGDITPAHANRRVGVAVISDQWDVHSHARDVISQAFTDSAKFRAISNGTAQASAGPVDVIQFTGVGPIALGAADEDTVVVAWLAGDSFADLQAQVLLAREKYLCTFPDAPLPIPAVPANVAASNPGCNTLDLDWDPAAGAAGYLVEVSTDAGFATLLPGFAPLAVTANTDTLLAGLDPGITYYVRVQAYGTPRCALSGYSTTAIGTTLPMPGTPTASAATAVGCNGFTANWAALGGVDGYVLDIATDAAYANLVVAGLDVGIATSYLASGLNASTVYYYRVRGYTVCGVTAASATETATTLPQGATPTSAGATVVGCDGFIARWHTATNATGFEVEAGTDPTFAVLLGGFPISLGPTDTSMALSGLSAGIKYYYRVRSISVCGASSWSVADSATTVAPLAAPNALAATSVSQCHFTANWDALPGAAAYRLDVSDDPTFATFLPGYEDTLVFGQTSAVIYNLTASTNYYYRVRGVNSCVPLSNSNVVTVATPGALAVPVAAPATLMGCTSFRANWNAVPNAVRYYIDVSTDPAFTSLVLTNAAVVAPTLFRTITGLSNATTYYYRVRASDNCETTANSNIETATTTDVPPANTALPATLIANCQFRASWTSSPTATAYRIDVSTTPTFDPGTLVRDNQNIGNVLTFTVNGLTGGTTYYYRIRPTNVCGSGANSNVESLVTPADVAGTPILDDPATALCNGFVINWPAVSGATTYMLDVSTDPGFATFVTGFNNLNIGNVTTRSVTTLNPNTTYYIRLRAVASLACPASANSNTVMVITEPQIPAPVANAATGLGCTTFDANWDAEPTATGYRLSVSTSPTFASFLPGFNNLDVGNVLTYNVPGLSLNTTYYYRVVAYNAACNSAVSNRITVLTPNVPPISNTNTGSTILCDQFQANWFATATATGYVLQVATDAAFTSPIPAYDGISVGNVLNLNVTGLNPNTNYYYRVRAENACGLGAYSTGRAVLTRPVLSVGPTAAAAAALTQCSFLAQWVVLANAQGYYLDVSTDNTFTLPMIINNLNVGNVLNHSVTGLTPGVTYYYRVRGYNNCSTSPNSATITRSTPVVPVPVSSAGTLIQPCQFQANWANPGGTPAPSAFLLDVATDAGFTSFILQDFNVGTAVNYLVTGLAPSTQYHYRVRNQTTCGTSAYSIVRTVTTTAAVAAPTTLAHSGVTCSAFNANWNAIAGATHYLLDASTDPGFGSFLPGYSAVNVGNVTIFTVTPIAQQQVYYYRVRAVSACGTSAPSANRMVDLTTGTAGLWTGAAGDSDWHNCLNWSNRVVPTGGNITIPSGAGSTPNNIPTGTFSSLDLDNALGIRLTGNLNITSYLRLANGIVDAQTNDVIVTVASAATDAVRNAANNPVTYTNTISYVAGTLVRGVAGGNTYTWPTGTLAGGQFAALHVASVSGGLGAVSVTYSATVPGAFPPAQHFVEGGAEFNAMLPDGYWILEPDAGTAVYDLEIWPTFPLACCLAYTYVKRSTPADPWGRAGSTPVFAGSNGVSGTGSIRRNGFTAFSEVAVVGSTLLPLPVEGLRLDAQWAGADAHLTWAPLSEQNLRGYGVEFRPETATAFEGIGYVAGRGTGSAYAFTHPEPGAGRHFYRLRVEDLDGRISYSNTVELAQNEALTAFTPTVWPNPANSSLNLDLSGYEGSVQVKWLDALGRTVRTGAHPGGSVPVFDVAAMAHGLYTLEVVSASGQRHTLRVALGR